VLSIANLLCPLSCKYHTVISELEELQIEQCYDIYYHHDAPVSLKEMSETYGQDCLKQN
jgi:hypothetical protein